MRTYGYTLDYDVKIIFIDRYIYCLQRQLSPWEGVHVFISTQSFAADQWPKSRWFYCEFITWNKQPYFWTFLPRQIKFDFLQEDRLICEDKRFLYVVMERVKGGELFEVGNWRAAGADIIIFRGGFFHVFSDSQFGWCGMRNSVV